MPRFAYVNGRYLPFRDAKVHVEDRGYQFADSVYEVCEVRAGHLIDERRHMDRLVRSLGELHLTLVERPGILPRPMANQLMQTLHNPRFRNSASYRERRHP